MTPQNNGGARESAHGRGVGPGPVGDIVRERPPDTILGVDPGTMTGWCLIERVGLDVIANGTLNLKGLKGLARFEAIRHVVNQCPVGDLVVIEDVSHSHSYKSGGRSRTPHATASVQRDYAALVITFLDYSAPVLLAPVASWYPRIGGVMMKKPLTIKALRAGAAPRKLKNEHIVMAYGLALYGVRWLKNDDLKAAYAYTTARSR